MTIHDVTALTQERWVNLFAATFENRGHVGRWVFASRKERPHEDRRPDAVILVPILRNPSEPARLVVLREFRVPVGDYCIGFPAGLIDEGESLVDTACRELAEETGLSVTAVKQVTPPLLMSSGLTDESACLAFVDVSGMPNPQPERSESLEVQLLDYEAVVRLSEDTTTRLDVKVWLILWMIRLQGQIA
ncbi:MAG: NUDIX hydrolase [Gemmataceae bacterium]